MQCDVNQTNGIFTIAINIMIIVIIGQCDTWQAIPFAGPGRQEDRLQVFATSPQPPQDLTWLKFSYLPKIYPHLQPPYFTLSLTLAQQLVTLYGKK